MTCLYLHLYFILTCPYLFCLIYYNLSNCTIKHLVKIDKTNTRKERCPVNKEWQEIQNAYNEFVSVGLIQRNKQIELDAKALIPNILGCITSYSARTGDLNIIQAFNNIYEDSQKYFKNKQTDFEKEVKNKMALIRQKGEEKHG